MPFAFWIQFRVLLVYDRSGVLQRKFQKVRTNLGAVRSDLVTSVQRKSEFTSLEDDLFLRRTERMRYS